MTNAFINYICQASDVNMELRAELILEFDDLLKRNMVTFALCYALYAITEEKLKSNAGNITV
jgi:hypothetical protein